MLPLENLRVRETKDRTREDSCHHCGFFVCFDLSRFKEKSTGFKVRDLGSSMVSLVTCSVIFDRSCGSLGLSLFV